MGRDQAGPSPHCYKVFCWNVGGLTTKWDELLVFLESQGVDIAILSETMWKNDSEFEARDWYVMGSGSGVSKGPGVVVLLSKHRFKNTHIRFQPELPGRILHVRITKGCSSLDVVAVYQHVWAIKPGEPLEHLLHRRRRIWDGLQRLLAKLPRRSRVIIGGDFNCSLKNTIRRMWGQALAPASPIQVRIRRTSSSS